MPTDLVFTDAAALLQVVLLDLALAGDNVSDDIWHWLVQIVTNNEDLQKYAASKLYHALESITAHETATTAQRWSSDQRRVARYPRSRRA
jgi:AP-2 complex subunit alpha